MAFLAIVAVGVEADREARRDLRIAELVPSFFQSYALETLARQAYERNEMEKGKDLALRLVERRPVPAETLSLYARGLLGVGDVNAAEPALQLAAQRGWRDRFVQRVVIVSSLENGRPAVASERVLGLWRQGDQSDWLKALTRESLETPEGLATFKSRLIEREGYWVPGFLNWAANSLSMPAVSVLVNSLSSRYSPFDCAVISGETDRMVRAGKVNQAIVFWGGVCRAHMPSRSNTLAFNSPRYPSGPFSWRYPEGSSVSVDLANSEEGNVLDYENSSAVRQTIARRYLQLKPSTYVLDKRNSNSGMEWKITCLDRGRISILPMSVYTAEAQINFEVPGVGCQIQELRLVARAGTGKINMPIIKRLSLARQTELN